MNTFLRRTSIIAKTGLGINLFFSFFISAQPTCPCSHATSYCQCMQLERLFLQDRKTHYAPVESVDWLCSDTATTYAAIGGYFDQNQNRDIRIYKLLTTGYLEEIDIGATAHGQYANDIVYSVDWCRSGTVKYLAIGGYPSSVDAIDVRVYEFNPDNPVATRLVEVATFRHYNKVRSVSWLCQECEGGSDVSVRYLAIGGDRSTADGYDIRVLKFDPTQPVANRLEEVCKRFHNASGAPPRTDINVSDVFSVDWVTCSNNTPLLAIGGSKPEIQVSVDPPIWEVVEDVSIRVYSFNCADESLQELTNKGDTGSRIREVRWCCDSKGNLYLAAGGTRVGGEQTTDPNIFLYKFNRSTCTLNKIASASAEGFKAEAYTVDFIPSCNCTHFTVGIGCVLPDFALPNILVYKRTSGSALTSKLYDQNVNSLRWCKRGDCNYLLVGTGLQGWLEAECPQTSEFEIALYQAVFCLPIEPPVIICAQRTCRRSPTQANIVNIFAWKPVAGAVKYEIYADEAMTRLLGTVLSNQNLVFCQYCINPCVRTTYYLTAVDASNNKSALVKVTI